MLSITGTSGAADIKGPYLADARDLGPAVNEDPYAIPVKNRDPHATNMYSRFDFGFMYWHQDYKEDLPAPLKSTESGWIPGIFLSYEYNKRNAFYLKIFTEFSYGDDTYDGSDQMGNPLVFSDNNHQFLFRGEIDVGYNFALSKSVAVKPYVGYGYRRWNRGQEAIIQGVATYQERYYWHYIPVGVLVEVNVNDRLTVEPNAGVRYMFYGRATAELSEVDPGFNDPAMKLGNRASYYVEMPIRYKLTNTWSIVLKPWFTYDQIGQSDPADLVYHGTVIGTATEPSSTAQQYGINLGLSAAF
jgi:hypothetical protein